jgi:hypothetical protein
VYPAVLADSLDYSLNPDWGSFVHYRESRVRIEVNDDVNSLLSEESSVKSGYAVECERDRQR